MRSTLVPLALAAVAAMAAPVALARMPAPVASAADTSLLAATAFSPQALGSARASRQPTFLYFTADWCITCKVNEKGALASPDVAQAFAQAGIQPMVGDWTRPDPDIARFLEERGRAGIPLYLFYAADGSVTELPQLLTVGMLTALATPGSSTSS